jgi:hypothetical protein
MHAAAGTFNSLIFGSNIDSISEKAEGELSTAQTSQTSTHKKKKVRKTSLINRNYKLN